MPDVGNLKAEEQHNISDLIYRRVQVIWNLLLSDMEIFDVSCLEYKLTRSKEAEMNHKLQYLVYITEQTLDDNLSLWKDSHRG